MAVQDGVLLQAHTGGKGRDLPVVNDGKGDFQFLTYVDEHRTDFFREIGIRNPRKRRLRVVDHPRRHRRTSAYGIEFGEVSLAFSIESMMPALVFRIGLVVRSKVFPR